jgi:hypothetical protein
MKRPIPTKAHALSLKFLALSLVFSSFSPLFSQEYRYEPFSRIGTKALRGLKDGSVIDFLMEGYGNAWCAWATSTLPAEGARPPKPASFKEPEDEWTYLQALSEWETMYAADKAADGDPATAWCEGAAGNGPGEALALRVDPGCSYAIFGGFGKNEDVWRRNARPKDVLVTLLRAAAPSGAAQHGTLLADLWVADQVRQTLADSFDYQELRIPDPGKISTDPYVLVIEILSVYPGSRYQDCLISEVRISGQSPAGMRGFGPD